VSLSETILAALRERAQMKAEGVSGIELERAFEQVVRDAWPKGREWFYICNSCDDTGWEYLQCPGDDTCGPSTWRPAANMPCPHRPRKPHAAHSYVRVCFCAKGRELRQSPSGESADFSSATKSKPRKFSRFGSE